MAKFRKNRVKQHIDNSINQHSICMKMRMQIRKMQIPKSHTELTQYFCFIQYTIIRY